MKTEIETQPDGKATVLSPASQPDGKATVLSPELTIEETASEAEAGGKTAAFPSDAQTVLPSETETAALPSETETAALPSEGPSLEAQLAEAEQRGYLRGRNERIEELMNEPAPYARQEQARQAVLPDDPSPSEPMILNNPRVSIWDR